SCPPTCKPVPDFHVEPVVQVSELIGICVPLVPLGNDVCCQSSDHWACPIDSRQDVVDGVYADSGSHSFLLSGVFDQNGGTGLGLPAKGTVVVAFETGLDSGDRSRTTTPKDVISLFTDYMGVAHRSSSSSNGSSMVSSKVCVRE